MDHVEIVVRLAERPDTGLTEEDLRAATRLEAKQLTAALADLIRGGIVRFDETMGHYCFDPRSPEDRAAVETLTMLYHQRPVTLVKFVYSMPGRAIATFADAFRLREDKP